ncbi:MAG: hypothetical protein LBP67_07510 [Bacteroidales bacterium]|jgi:hypothetical protein|nr:hypothetical protein [Bacteroidales bacterium]
MKKTNIIVIITIIIIFAGICINGIILRNRFLKGEFDDPYKNGIKKELPQITAVKIMNWPGKYSNNYTGKSTIVYCDSINEIISQTKEDISMTTEGSLLTVWKVVYSNTLIKISDLENLEASNNQSVFVNDFTLTNLDILASDSVTITLNNCKIENLNINADNKVKIDLDSTNLIKNINLILTSSSTFSSRNIEFDNFIFDIEDDCSLNLSGKSLKVLTE